MTSLIVVPLCLGVILSKLNFTIFCSINIYLESQKPYEFYEKGFHGKKVRMHVRRGAFKASLALFPLKLTELQQQSTAIAMVFKISFLLTCLLEISLSII